MSSPAERSPKRRRTDSSVSPPPESKQKTDRHSPQTPPPSVRMSPSWQSQSQSQSTTTNHPSSAASATFPTPPSTTGYHSHHTMGDHTGSERGIESELQTPMTDYEPPRRDFDGDEDMRNDSDIAAQSKTSTFGDLAHRRTDHEREASGANATSASLSGVRRLYTTCTEPIKPSQPHATDNFIELYGLQRVQASVARRDAAGNKINKLRKSYENKVKNLGLEGRSKAQVGNAALQGLVDPGWDMDVGNGMTQWQAHTNELKLGGPSMDDVLSKLDSALALASGHLPPKEHEHWKGILGLDGSGAKTTPSLNPSKPPPGTGAFAKADSGSFQRNSAPASPRPERTGKKRRYNEGSYTGYQEGFDDDGYSTGGLDDGNRRGSFKRQKMQQRKVGV